LQGEKPVGGSGKVLNSGPNDHVFINLVDHGANGLFAFPSEIMTTKQLIDGLNKLHDTKKFAKLTIYVESCESGSLFKDQLKPNINIYATTASDWNENSWACYCSSGSTCLGDCYSVNWMEDSDKEDIESETLSTQFDVVKKLTTESHVQQYGELDLDKMTVGQFQGSEKAAPLPYVKQIVPRSAVPSPDVPLHLLEKQVAMEKDLTRSALLKNELQLMKSKRAAYVDWINELVKSIAGEKAPEVMNQRLPLKNVDCHHRLTTFFHSKCINFSKNSFALTYAYTLTNICELGFNSDMVERVMTKQCSQKKLLEPIL